MRSEVASNQFEISNCIEKSFRLHGSFNKPNHEISNPFQKLFRLHGDFTASNLHHQVIVRLKAHAQIIAFNQYKFNEWKTDVVLMVVFSITVATHMLTSYYLKWFCATLLHCRHLLFTLKTCCSLIFHFGQFEVGQVFNVLHWS